jgi:hypothetical protein
LTKNINDFSEVIFGTVTAARKTGLAAAMIRGPERRPSQSASPLASLSIFLFRQAVHDGNVEPGHRRGRLNHTHATFLCSRALPLIPPAQGIAVVGNGNTDVGSKTPTRESGQAIVERLASDFPDLRIDHQNGLKREGARKCGAMSEQSADSGRGNEQVPQKLVHLVGYRDPNAGPDPWIRPQPIPAKR